MRVLKPDPNTDDMTEPGEEELAMLIKEAGAAARVRKKKIMEKHYIKLHQAVTGTLPSTMQSGSA